MPGAEITRHTLIHLAGFPAERVVAKGEPFEVGGSVEFRSFWEPPTGSARFRDNQPLSADIADGKVKFSVPGQVEDGDLTVSVGDAEHAVAIRPVSRPAMRELHARIALPDYLKYPMQNEIVQAGYLPVLRGSTVQFQGRVSRNLNEAQVAIDEVGTPMQVRNESSPVRNTRSMTRRISPSRGATSMTLPELQRGNLTLSQPRTPRPAPILAHLAAVLPSSRPRYSS